MEQTNFLPGDEELKKLREERAELRRAFGFGVNVDSVPTLVATSVYEIRNN